MPADGPGSVSVKNNTVDRVLNKLGVFMEHKFLTSFFFLYYLENCYRTFTRYTYKLHISHVRVMSDVLENRYCNKLLYSIGNNAGWLTLQLQLSYKTTVFRFKGFQTLVPCTLLLEMPSLWNLFYNQYPLLQ